jgi:mannose/cellobiose epimerase-like protein (N-acyl-D-glucosamine 2-epimerase family)
MGTVKRFYYAAAGIGLLAALGSNPACAKELPAPAATLNLTGLTMPAQPRVDLADLLERLPDGSRWIRHLKEDLLPFWDNAAALGNPVGNFPTYRCNDGSLFNPKAPCQELANPDPSVRDIIKLDRDYVRMKSRQVFAYGIAYHMTGDKKWLDYCRDGVNYLRKFALDRENGKVAGAYTYFSGADHVPGPPAAERTSQDLAYAATGIGFYYYLTRDPAVLKDVRELKEYIFATYYDPRRDIITWVKQRSPDGDSPDQLELVAQLDQAYGYMMWLTPAMPQQDRVVWTVDLRHLARIMVTQFFSPRENMFWGAITTSQSRQLGQPHTDFGHTVKTLWLIYEIGKLTNDLTLTDFGRVHAAEILERAYIPQTGSWGRRIDDRGKLDPDKEWWILCELDQVAATLGMLDPGYARYLPQTYEYWFLHMVDKDHHGIWHWVNAADNQPNRRIPKEHSWKNALHTFEHALVGYITGQQIHDQPVTLYFAFKDIPPEEEIHPYFFEGQVASITRSDAGVKVVFTGIR